MLEKYKSGTATKEERQMVEAEIAKSEAINDYLSAQIMEAIPYETNAPLSSAFAGQTEAAKIRKHMNRKLGGVVTASVSIVIAIVCVVQFAVFPIINSSYYNPLDGRQYTAGTEWGQMSIDMSVFSELHMQGYETHFISLLKYMAAKKDFLDVIRFRYGYADALVYVQKNGILCHGVVVTGNRNAIEKLVVDYSIPYIAIDDVMVSSFSRD
jgi:hypothetical protein